VFKIVGDRDEIRIDVSAHSGQMSKQFWFKDLAVVNHTFIGR